MSEVHKTSAVIVAAGRGSRMQADINKQYLLLFSMPVLAHTIMAFEQTECISEIVIVINEKERHIFEDLICNSFNFSKIAAVVNGGRERQESVYQGLLKTSPESGIIAVHDGARPLVTPDIIKNSIEIAVEYGAACVGVPVKDTIKRSDRNQTVQETLDRSCLWLIQTPQVFQRDIIQKAHEYALKTGFQGTDDSMLVERTGYEVHMVMGSYSNIKITTPEDLVYAEAILGR